MKSVTYLPVEKV